MKKDKLTKKGLSPALVGLIGGIAYFILFAAITFIQIMNTPCGDPSTECIGRLSWFIFLPVLLIISIIMGAIFGLIDLAFIKSSKTKDGKPNRYQPYIMVIVIIIAVFISYLLSPIK